MQRTTYPPDRRGFGRRESRIHALARLPGRGAEPCIVLNISSGGALLTFQTSAELPPRFRLVVEAKGIDAMCEVRRQAGNEVGVSFIEPETTTASLVATAPLPLPLGMSAIPDEEPVPAVAAPRLVIGSPPVLVMRGDEVRRIWQAGQD